MTTWEVFRGRKPWSIELGRICGGGGGFTGLGNWNFVRTDCQGHFSKQNPKSRSFGLGFSLWRGHPGGFLPSIAC